MNELVLLVITVMVVAVSSPLLVFILAKFATLGVMRGQQVFYEDFSNGVKSGPKEKEDKGEDINGTS